MSGFGFSCGYIGFPALVGVVFVPDFIMWMSTAARWWWMMKPILVPARC